MLSWFKRFLPKPIAIGADVSAGPIFLRWRLLTFSFLRIYLEKQLRDEHLARHNRPRNEIALYLNGSCTEEYENWNQAPGMTLEQRKRRPWRFSWLNRNARTRKRLAGGLERSATRIVVLPCTRLALEYGKPKPWAYYCADKYPFIGHSLANAMPGRHEVAWQDYFMIVDRRGEGSCVANDGRCPQCDGELLNVSGDNTMELCTDHSLADAFLEHVCCECHRHVLMPSFYRRTFPVQAAKSA